MMAGLRLVVATERPLRHRSAMTAEMVVLYETRLVDRAALGISSTLPGFGRLEKQGRKYLPRCKRYAARRFR